MAINDDEAHGYVLTSTDDMYLVTKLTWCSVHKINGGLVTWGWHGTVAVAFIFLARHKSSR